MGAVGTGICVFLMLGIVSAIPIAMICLGALRMDQCTMEPWIPKFMVVAGAAGLVTVILSMCTYGCASNDSQNNGTVTCLSVLIGLITLFSFAWNIAGSVWVFKKWSNWENLKHSCNNDLYLFAFAYLIIFWITCPCQMGGGVKAKQSSGDV